MTDISRKNPVQNVQIKARKNRVTINDSVSRVDSKETCRTSNSRSSRSTASGRRHSQPAVSVHRNINDKGALPHTRRYSYASIVSSRRRRSSVISITSSTSSDPFDEGDEDDPVEPLITKRQGGEGVKKIVTDAKFAGAYLKCYTEGNVTATCRKDSGLKVELLTREDHIPSTMKFNLEGDSIILCTKAIDNPTCDSDWRCVIKLSSIKKIIYKTQAVATYMESIQEHIEDTDRILLIVLKDHRTMNIRFMNSTDKHYIQTQILTKIQ